MIMVGFPILVVTLLSWGLYARIARKLAIHLQEALGQADVNSGPPKPFSVEALAQGARRSRRHGSKLPARPG
jgi:hypothetical protein